MKTLAELRTEVDFGMEVYPTTNHDVIVTKWGEHYVFLRYEDGTQREHLIDAPNIYIGTCIQFFAEADGSGGILVDKEDCYTTFDELLADWPRLAAMSVWGTTRTPERLQYEETHKQVTEKGPHFSRVVDDELLAEIGKKARGQVEWEKSVREQQNNESTVPLASQLGRDVARYVDRYFPGGSVTGIQSHFHSGFFIGDYSIDLDVNLDHPIVQRVGVSFSHEDVPSRPGSWQNLLTLSGIRLFLHSITLRNVGYGEDNQGTSVTYSIPGMYENQVKQWCNKQDDGMLYGSIETPDMFIITTELMSHSHEEVEQAAKLLAVQAKAKLEQESQSLAESPNLDDPLEGF